MYYRRKILLSLLQLFDNQLEKIQLQKLLMLFSQHQSKKNYHFIPYKYGCFSFQANADLGTMKKYKLVEEQEKTWIKITNEDYFSTLKKEDKLALKSIKEQYYGKSSDELIAYTYKQFPYFAINSTVAEKHLSNSDLVKIEQSRPVNKEIALYTIGYEGISLEEYINKLIEKDVKILCDVRKNSFSMKYGFSKSQLKAACEGVGIVFHHFPEVGIISDKRKSLETQADYDLLFQDYNETVIPQTRRTQDVIIELVDNYKRVAITCFEADKCQCHRSHLANAISEKSKSNFSTIHL
jgi:uncharacterized protein (DUF488 family)